MELESEIQLLNIYRGIGGIKNLKKLHWKDNKFVLLHYYIKKTQKTPHREISKALAYMHDWLERNNS